MSTYDKEKPFKHNAWTVLEQRRMIGIKNIPPSKL